MTTSATPDRFTNPQPGDWFAELFAGAEIIHAYTRADAIADGTLIDVTETAREAGFRFPVAMTAAAWADAVAWSEADEKRKPAYTGQDEAGRLWDVVWIASRCIAAAKAGGHGDLSRLPFRVLRVPAEGRGLRPRYCDLVAVVGPGDTAAPVITIMTPTED